MPNPEINEVTRREWRELGFYYERDDVAKEWRLLGSTGGLRRFAKALQDYAADPRNEALSEHEHFGPYQYLEVGTWTSPEITQHWIAGPLSAIRHLGLTLQAQLNVVSFGGSICLRTIFAPHSPYEFVLQVQADSFDPAEADLYC